MSPTQQSDGQKTNQHLLIRAALGEEVERPPVWAMRQAGRWDPEFRKLRAGHTFYEFTENVELAAKASLCPKRFGVDAIILFYDITTLAVAMGLPFTLEPERGPVPADAIRTVEDVERLDPQPPVESFQHVRELLKVVKRELNGELPVIVFAGAPFTLATYCIGTGKNLEATRRFAWQHGMIWELLLERIRSATVHFLRTLADDGADIFQLFDSWAGELTEVEYRCWAQPHHEAIFAGVSSIPSILFVKECPYLELMTQSGANVVSLGTRHDLAAARRDYPHMVFQGNVDEEILRKGTVDQVREAVRQCMAASGGQRHIINLNHGVGKETPVENFQAFVREVRGSSLAVDHQ